MIGQLMHRFGGRRVAVLAVSFLAVTAALVGCPQAAPPAPDEGITDVLMESFAFSPAEVRIQSGERVRWTNQDIVPHTTTSGNPGDDEAGAIWDSEFLSAGQSFTRQFDEPGEFVYFCRVHPVMMRDAKVIVDP